MTEDIEILGDDNYPTEDFLEYLETYRGSLCDFVELVQLAWVNGWVTEDPIEKRWESDADLELRLVTEGWGGNESILSSLDRTFFSLRFWESSHRGGLEVYRYPSSQLDIPDQYWGKIERYTND